MQRPITFPAPSWLLTAVLVLGVAIPGGIAALIGDDAAPVATSVQTLAASPHPNATNFDIGGPVIGPRPR